MEIRSIGQMKAPSGLIFDWAHGRVSGDWNLEILISHNTAVATIRGFGESAILLCGSVSARSV